MNLPDYQFLSTPLWLITVLHILTLSLHFVAMNFLLGGVIFVLAGKSESADRHLVPKRMARIFPSLMAATVTLGVAPLLFLQLVYHRQVYSAAIVMGWFWLWIIPAVILSYFLLYHVSFAREAGPNRRRCLTLALPPLIYVSLVYSAVFSMAEHPNDIREFYAKSQAGLFWNPMIADYFFRWLHMILGAVTVGGFFAGWLGRRDPSVFRRGRNFFLWGMAAASVAGMIYLLTLGDYLAPLMRTPAIWFLTAGVLLAAGSLHFYFRRGFAASGLFLLVSIAFMVTTRHYLRLLKLAGSFEPSSLRVAPQWSPFMMFLICFVIALGVVGYSLRLFFGDRKPGLAP